MSNDPSRDGVSRRGFLKQGGAIATAASVGMPLVMNLVAPRQAHAAAASDYKALVCVFLAGGNDSHNTVFRTDRGKGPVSNLTRFLEARPTVGGEVVSNGVAKLPLNLDGFPNNTGISGLSLALHPSLKNIKALFEANKLAILGNVGPLRKPTTATEVLAGTASMPPKLSSHNDQTSIWQSGYPEGAISGWGGEIVRRLGDRNSVGGKRSQLFSAVAIESSPVFCSGTHQAMPGELDVVSPFGAAKGSGALRPGGVKGTGSETTPPFTVHGQIDRDTVLKPFFDGAVGRSEFTHLIEEDYLGKMANAERAWAASSKAMSGVSLNNSVPQGNMLAAQLAVVAKMIKAHANDPLAMGRQVFYVQHSGYDTHSAQVGGVHSAHLRLLEALDTALKFFDDELGADRDKVLTFTASEFGRKLNENGDGTDHGWGGHHFVMGGGVKSGVFGYFPDLGTWNSQKARYDDEQILPDGTLVPSFPVDAYARELGQWLGVDWNTGDNKAVAEILFPNFPQAKMMGFTAA